MGVSINGVLPFMDGFFMEHPNQKWMRTGGTTRGSPISGNPQSSLELQMIPTSPECSDQTTAKLDCQLHKRAGTVTMVTATAAADSVLRL